MLKRVKEFCKCGEIALLRDFVSTATLAGGVIALVACASSAFSALLDLTRDAALATDGAPTIDLPRTALRAFLSATAPALLGAAGAAVVAILVQLGWPPAFKKLSFDLSRISPLANLKQTFALGAVAKRSGTAIAKMIVVGAIVALALRGGLAFHPMQASSIARLLRWDLTWLMVRDGSEIARPLRSGAPRGRRCGPPAGAPPGRRRSCAGRRPPAPRWRRGGR